MAAKQLHIGIKRVYEPKEAADGTRVLVDRLWPRGMTKQNAHVDEWLKDVAPTAGLRRWFGHDVARWAEFQRRYRAELRANNGPLARLRELADAGKLTLVYAARDQDHNHALVLLDCLVSFAKTKSVG